MGSAFPSCYIIVVIKSGMKILRSQSTFAVLAGLKKTNNHPESTKSNAKKKNDFLTREQLVSCFSLTMRRFYSCKCWYITQIVIILISEIPRKIDIPKFSSNSFLKVTDETIAKRLVCQ